jgi:hypothetical protein
MGLEKAKEWLGHEADHFLISRAKAKKLWSYTSVPFGVMHNAVQGCP